MSEPDPVPDGPWAPRHPWLVAAAVFAVAGILLFWPIFTGQFLAGPSSDQYVAGYGFRLFGAEHFREHGSIPLWNPYLFGGLPFVAAMHGDVFYPTAWLRWVLPTDTAMNLGFALHIVLAGCTMFAFLRGLGVAWAAAVIGGVAWEMTGLVAGLVHPGHDGKLFVAALTPLLFLALLRAVRTGRVSSFGLIALTVGLALHGHPQLTYYLLVAAGLWAAWLVFIDPERPARSRWPVLIAGGLGAVVLGFGLYAVQALPFYEYIPFSPRAPEAGASTGWEYATAYSLPPVELMSLVLPEFNGLKDAYWGTNFLKHHTEYVGLLPLALAVLGLGDRRRRPVIWALAGIAALFLLIAFGGHTPFYRLWYEVMPLMKKVRAPGMAFFLVAFAMSVFAAFGAERLLRGDLTVRKAAIPVVALSLLGVLGLVGALQPVAETLAAPHRLQLAMANAAELRLGGLRLTLVGLLALGAVAAVAARRFRGAGAFAVLGAVTVADLWSVERQMFVFQPGAAVTYRDDEITATIRRQPLPYRVLDAGIYHGSWLMAHRIPALLGYHGNELRWFDDLLGGKNVWQNWAQPVLWDLYAVRFIVLHEDLELNGWRQVVGPVPAATGGRAWLYEAEAPPAWVRIVPAAAKIPEAGIIPTLLDPRFPADRVLLYPDTSSLAPAALDGAIPEPAPIEAELQAWTAGRMAVSLTGVADDTTYLLVSENWYPDWRATVDGRETPTFRANNALLSVPVPPGAREVTLEFRSRAYERGRLISLLAAVLVLGMLAVPGSRKVAPGE